MSWWADYKALLADNLRHGAGDGIRAAISGKRVDDVARDRREQQKERTVVDLATLQVFLNGEQARYNQVVAAERARGNRGYPDVTLEISRLGDQLAVTRYSMNGDRRRIEIFYDGASSNPLSTPEYDYHGHIVIDDDTITSWLEPGPKNQRNRLY